MMKSVPKNKGEGGKQIDRGPVLESWNINDLACNELVAASSECLIFRRVHNGIDQPFQHNFYLCCIVG